MKGDRVMPIGFWAVSRQDVVNIYELRAGYSNRPAKMRHAVNRIIRLLPDQLDAVLDKAVADQLQFEAEVATEAKGK